MKKEVITHEASDSDAWICICGNQPSEYGFYPCNVKFELCEPDSLWDQPYYRCDKCKRVINAFNLEVVGVAS